MKTTNGNNEKDSENSNQDNSPQNYKVSNHKVTTCIDPYPNLSQRNKLSKDKIKKIYEFKTT